MNMIPISSLLVLMRHIWILLKSARKGILLVEKYVIFINTHTRTHVYLKSLVSCYGCFVIFKVAEELRENVYKATGLTCSAGVAPNRLLAKVCFFFFIIQNGFNLH